MSDGIRRAGRCRDSTSSASRTRSSITGARAATGSSSSRTGSDRKGESLAPPGALMTARLKREQGLTWKLQPLYLLLDLGEAGARLLGVAGADEAERVGENFRTHEVRVERSGLPV